MAPKFCKVVELSRKSNALGGWADKEGMGRQNMAVKYGNNLI
jgi:hypothetical protein